MNTRYEPSMSLQAARDRYFADNGFGADGGYNDAWVDFKLGPVPMPFPNTAGRARAVGYHDLHHVLTGYATDTLGELEIAAWELGAGCGSVVTAWVINLGGMLAGLIAAPRRTARAFFRGRRGNTFYGRKLEELLALRVEEGRRLIGEHESRAASLNDYAALVACTALAIPTGCVTLSLFLPLVPVGMLVHALRERQKLVSTRLW